MIDFLYFLKMLPMKSRKHEFWLKSTLLQSSQKFAKHRTNNFFFLTHERKIQISKWPTLHCLAMKWRDTPPLFLKDSFFGTKIMFLERKFQNGLEQQQNEKLPKEIGILILNFSMFCQCSLWIVPGEIGLVVNSSKLTTVDKSSMPLSFTTAQWKFLWIYVRFLCELSTWWFLY